MTRNATKPLVGAAIAAVAVLVLAACGDTEGGDYGGQAPDYKKALAGAPAPLAKLYSQGDRLLDGGADAFKAQLTKLRGYPVVVNKWASWCAPCRAEFPFLQNLSARYGKRVAFVGVDSNDSEDAAKTFLGEYPQPYPSYNDPDQEIAQTLNATLGFPSTAFYDRKGELVYLRQGGYASEEDMRADIERYALGS
jgi:cytochrome c biogenesis protein CcmG, thiol:disulfide interchange protein DsbE